MQSSRSSGRDAALDTSPVGMGVFEGREAIRGFYEEARAVAERLAEEQG